MKTLYALAGVGVGALMLAVIWLGLWLWEYLSWL